jgi:hypothetical protein
MVVDVLLAFVDESFNKSLFCLSALVVDEAAVVALTAELDSVIAPIVAAYGDVKELHGHEIFHAAAGWHDVPLRLRMNVYVRAMRAIGRSGAAAVFSDLPWAGAGDTSPPHEQALQRLLGSLQTLAVERDERILVLADEVHSAERHRTNFRFYQGPAGGLDRILDTLYFGPSHHSRLLQASDLLTYMRLRRLTVAESDPRAERVNDTIWASVEGIVWRGDQQHKGPDLATGA